MGDHDRGIDVQAELFIEVRSCPCSPCVCAGQRPSLSKEWQTGIAHPVEDTPRGRGGGDGTEQLRVVPQDRQVTDRVGAVGDGDGNVGEDPTGKVDRQCLVRAEEGRVPGPGEPTELRDLSQQLRTSVGHHALAVGGYLDPS